MEIYSHFIAIKKYLRFYIISFLCATQIAQAFQVESGNLATVIKTIDYGDTNENIWKQPSSSAQAIFSQVMLAFLEQDYNTVDTLTADIGYELIEFNHSAKGKSQTYYILREKNPLPSPLFTGGGTYVSYPEGVNITIEAPHPISDSFTGNQAVETFLSIQARLLFLPGTRRDSSTELSPCSNGHYRKSDASHYTDMFFYLAHSLTSDFYPDLIFVQLHGFGSSSLAKLQNQCVSNNEKLINLSEGVNYASDPSANSFMHILQRNVNQAGIIKACVYGNDTSSLGGTWTTTGRYTNNSSDSCNNNSSTSSERFIHLEQSYRVRSNHRADMSQYLTATINEYFQLTPAKKENSNKGKGSKK